MRLRGFVRAQLRWEHRIKLTYIAVDQRRRDHEAIKQKAMDNGAYVERLDKDECACCVASKWLSNDKSQIMRQELQSASVKGANTWALLAM